MKKKLVSIIVCMLLFATVSSVAVTQNNDCATKVNDSSEVGDVLDVDWWPMFRHDLNHTGYSTSTAPDRARANWTYNSNLVFTGSPAVVNGRVYIGEDDFAGSNGRMLCLNAENGSEIWTYTINRASSSPAVVDGRVYISSRDFSTRGVYCFNADNGSLIWFKQFGQYNLVESSPAVAYGRVYVGSNHGRLYCLNATDGNVLWKFQTGDTVHSSPAVVDGRVYVGSYDGNVYCLNATTDVTSGEKIWNFTTNGSVRSSPAVVDGRVYVGSADGNVYCLNASDGVVEREIWNFTTGGGDVFSSPAVTADGKVIVGSHNKEVYCLDAESGVELWRFATGDIVGSSPAVVDGRVYIGSIDGNVYCLEENEPPETPDQPSGPTEGLSGIEYIFSTSTIDPEGDTVRYGWDWNGDMIVDTWTGLNPSGVIVNTTHMWGWSGVYDIRVKAKDKWDAESGWSESLTITITNDPPETPSQPSGPTEGDALREHTFTTNTTDPDGHKVQYGWNWTGLKPSGQNVSTKHAWPETGVYNVTVKAKDQYGAWSDWSETSYITITEFTNEPPEIPRMPDGPTIGEPGVQYTFSTNTTDPERDEVQYGWDWDGDMIVDTWTGLKPSGATASTKHTWTEKGIYNISVKAKDKWGAEGDWSDPLTITITNETSPDLEIGGITGEWGGLGKGGVICAEINNTAYVYDANDVNWSISVKGGIFGLVNVVTNGTINTLETGGTIKVCTEDPIFGLGNIDINVTVSEPLGSSDTKTATALVIGPFIINIMWDEPT